MKHLLLIGGGHAHLSVLHALARQPVADLQTTLVTPHPQQTYSGMLPGWMAGHYTLEDCQIDLRPLVKLAGVTLLLDNVTGMDADQQTVTLGSGNSLSYDLSSLDIGSESITAGLEARGDRLLPVRPLDGLLKRWPAILQAAGQKPDFSLAVLGGGAAGIELALAIRYAFSRRNLSASVHLVSPKLLQGHAEAVVVRVLKQLHAAGIHVHPDFAQGSEQGLELASGKILPVDLVLAATGAQAAGWLRGSGLELDGEGYIRVSDEHQSLSHPNVFAAGDVASRSHMHFGRSGVHAVHAGKALAHNLPAFLQGRDLMPYQPKRRSLYLLATGPQQAIASWGNWSAQGSWVWHWKDYIDRSFMRKHRVSV